MSSDEEFFAYDTDSGNESPALVRIASAQNITLVENMYCNSEMLIKTNFHSFIGKKFNLQNVRCIKFNMVEIDPHLLALNWPMFSRSK